MRYVVSGATSDTGGRTVKLLADKVGMDNITCFVRSRSDVSFLSALGMSLYVGDVSDSRSLQGALSPGVSYVDMTHPRFYPASVDALLRSGVQRAYFVTTTGMFSRYNQFAQMYRDNEALIRASGLTYTILRPTMIYGTPRDKNMNRLVRFLSRSPIAPVVGAGRALMQPVHVDDLAAGIVAAINERHTENEDYNLAGPQAVPFRQIIRTIATLLGRRIRLVNIRGREAAVIARWAGHVPGFPVTEEQVLRLLEDKAFDITKPRKELHYHPRTFSEGIASEIASMRSAGLVR